MIIGFTQSADGCFRRIPIRHTHIVDENTRLELVSYLKERVYQKCLELDWVGCKDIFPNLPDDVKDTPLKIIYEICCEKFADTPNSLVVNLAKYLGLLIREAVYYSEVEYFEQMPGTIRTYSLVSKKLKDKDYQNGQNIIDGEKE